MTAQTSGVERLDAVFRRTRAAGRAALIPYLCGGDPDLATSEALVAAVAAAGADIIELGIPYGDPLADGPTIAAAAQRALEAGTTVDAVLAIAARLHAAGGPPLLLFTYVNPIVQYGLEHFADALVAAGASGAIVPDLPLEEMSPLRAAFGPRGLALPLLIAPTTPLERAVAIAERSDGFAYLVSRLGVTSASREPDFGPIAARVAQLRERTARPLAVGFGIATPAHVRAVAAIADGAIVGSALIDAYAGTRGDEAVERVSALFNALDAGRSAAAS